MQESEVSMFVEYLRAIHTELGQAGWVAMLGVLFYGFVKTYRMSIVQRLVGWVTTTFKSLWFLRKYILWAEMGDMTKLVFVAVPTGLAAFFLTVHAEGSWSAWFPALMSALGGVASAMGFRKGQKIATVKAKATAGKLKAVVAKLKRKP